jgi:hypothetical protein
MTDDEKAWLPVAEAVLRGKYDNIDLSLKKSVETGLNNITDPTCQQALAYLKTKVRVKTLTVD